MMRRKFGKRSDRKKSAALTGEKNVGCEQKWVRKAVWLPEGKAFTLQERTNLTQEEDVEHAKSPRRRKGISPKGTKKLSGEATRMEHPPRKLLFFSEKSSCA